MKTVSQGKVLSDRGEEGEKGMMLLFLRVIGRPKTRLDHQAGQPMQF